MSLHIETEHTDDEISVALQGDITIQNSPELRQTLKPLFESDAKRIRIKLDGVKFMDSSGIATLVEGLQWSKACEGHFILSGLTETVRDVFELAKLDTVFQIEG